MPPVGQPRDFELSQILQPPEGAGLHAPVAGISVENELQFLQVLHSLRDFSIPGDGILNRGPWKLLGFCYSNSVALPFRSRYLSALDFRMTLPRNISSRSVVGLITTPSRMWLAMRDWPWEISATSWAR